MNKNRFLIGLTAATLAACAGAPERPTAEMTRARTLIEQAEQQGAQQYAAAELERARQKLQQAEAEADEGDTEVSQRLTMQAALDAELASALAAKSEAQKAAGELAQSIETLREEAARRQAPTSTEPDPGSG